jgi:hypothetical protein
MNGLKKFVSMKILTFQQIGNHLDVNDAQSEQCL